MIAVVIGGDGAHQGRDDSRQVPEHPRGVCDVGGDQEHIQDGGLRHRQGWSEVLGFDRRQGMVDVTVWHGVHGAGTTSAEIMEW